MRSPLPRSLNNSMTGLQALAIVLTSGLLEWLRELPTRRALHMLKLLHELLRKHGEGHWTALLGSAAARLRDAHAARSPDQVVDAMQHILRLFGGMGSFSDLYLSARNGHRIKPEAVDLANARLASLRTQLFLSAKQTIARIEWQRRGH